MKPTPVRRILWVLAILVALGLLMAGLARAQPVQIIDDKGRRISLPSPPQRIVSLLPSLTESVCELEQCHRLVGVGGEVEPPGGMVLLHQLLEPGLVDRHAPGLQPLDLGLVDIDAEHVMADLGQHRPLHQPDISGSENRDLHPRYSLGGPAGRVRLGGSGPGSAVRIRCRVPAH